MKKPTCRGFEKLRELAKNVGESVRKEPHRADTMGVFDKRLSIGDLGCDFPARESFREGLLARLLSMDEQELRQAAGENDDSPEDGFRAYELSDSDLEFIAAAQGGFHRNIDSHDIGTKSYL